MKYNFVLLAVLFVGITITQAQTEKYGSEITLKEETPISSILENPEEYLGQKVLVKGEVLDVCPKMGCWMELKSDADGSDKIKVKVEDGVIVFPTEAVGKKAVVEGEVYKIELNEEEAQEYFKHIAEESGKEFDPESVSGPVTIYQIKGLGAEIFSAEG